LAESTNFIERKSFSERNIDFHVDDLLELQKVSYEDFLQSKTPLHKRLNEGLQSVFGEYFPLEDNNGEMELLYDSYGIGVSRYSMSECKERGITYGAPLKIKFSLLKYKKKNKTSEERTFVEKITNDVYLGDIPIMTDYGSFIINGAERVIVSQLHRSPGVFFAEDEKNNKKIVSARVIPYRGSWVEFFVEKSGIYINLGRNKKIPVSVLLRALGFDTDEAILNEFIGKKSYTLSKIEAPEIVSKIVASDVVDKNGEVIIEEGSSVDQTLIERLKENKISKLEVWDFDKKNSKEILYRTVKGDDCESRMDALEIIYNLVRTGELPSEETGVAILERVFFSERRYDLGTIGRYRLNKRLYGDDEKFDDRVLNETDIKKIIKNLLQYFNTDEELDDIDHLSNRRVRAVGELLEHKFAAALSRLTRIIKEKMSTVKDVSNVNELVNARAVYTIVMSFFQTSQLSQFMDQTNPISEITNKRRLSSLGPGGLSRERAGFEVRDVHYTHYGKICPVETPEGPNIGLIVSLANFARVNKFGFLMTPFKKVIEGNIQKEINYLTADEEEKYFVASFDSVKDGSNKLSGDSFLCRKKGEYYSITANEVEYIDVSSFQMVSVSAAMIPFLEHDDANRALMGANMQRQAVPLLKPEAPLVGTGMERKAAVDSGAVVVSKVDGVVVYVDAKKIIIKPNTNAKKISLLFEEEVYNLRKFERSNQSTSINQRPVVSIGDKVKIGDVIADGMATDRGDVALGKNPLIAFMCWQGYNFEDAIIMSEKLVHNDSYTSVHISEYEVEVRDTKRGPEEITQEIPNFTEDSIKDLDENGIIRVGAELKPGDIMVGKVTPKGETDLSPEEKLLRAIFGDRAGDVRDTSLRANPGMKGVVIGTKILSRKKQSKKTRARDRERIEELELNFARKNSSLIEKRTEILNDLLIGKKSELVLNRNTKRVILDENVVFDKKLILGIDFENSDLTNGIVKDDVNDDVVSLIEKSIELLKTNEDELEREIDKVMRGDELKPDVLQLVKVYVATKKKLSVGDKFAGRHGNKGVVSNIAPVEDMPFLEDGRSVEIILNPLGIPSRMNVGQLLETHLGWAALEKGYYVKVPVFDGLSVDQIKKELKGAGLPENGQVQLRDGRTGEKFENKVTIGCMYYMKLNHLVADKVHARSIGPYSLITQQPLGGKSQFGGQRLGEMEVWALEAYGASYLLQELITVKSDDVIGRVKVYESIVTGKNLPKFGIPESFKVLINEIRALGIDIYVG